MKQTRELLGSLWMFNFIRHHNVISMTDANHNLHRNQLFANAFHALRLLVPAELFSDKSNPETIKRGLLLVVLITGLLLMLVILSITVSDNNNTQQHTTNVFPEPPVIDNYRYLPLPANKPVAAKNKSTGKTKQVNTAPKKIVEKTILVTPAQTKQATTEQINEITETVESKPVEKTAPSQPNGFQLPVFSKVAVHQSVTNPDEQQWDCVEDKANGLVWESKTSDGGLRDKNNSYSWYMASHDQVSGKADGGRCKGSIDCDTRSYIKHVNENKLCGYSDWRLPTKEELMLLVNFKNSGNGAVVDTEYFPNAVPSWYWTANSNKTSEAHAWYVLFRNGIALSDLKERGKHIRLVRDYKKTAVARY